MAGKNITQVGDQLSPLSLERLYQGLTQPKGNLPDLVQQLRSLKTIDPNGYRRAKTRLPYVVCGYFTPPVRKKAHFAWIEHVIIDLDKLSSRGFSVEGIKQLLQKDERIALLFSSPGNDGVKAVFNLQIRIHDAAYYSHFYKIFAARLATQYKLEGVVDLVTNDVSRCCFMSYDPHAWFNAGAITVDAGQYLNQNDIQGIVAAEAALKVVEKARDNMQISDDSGNDESAVALTDDTLWKIKQKLRPELAKRQRPQKEYIQPRELAEFLPALQEKLRGLGIEVAETRMIDYGRQLKLVATPHWAELNLFFGRRGFTVVKTTKTGSNKELASLGEEAIRLHFEDSGQAFQ